MIREIYISNFALINDLQLPLSKGFSTITGDTGAGKSILLEALSIALGDRADKSAVRNNDKKCVVEVQIDISAYNIERIFKQNDWDYDDLTIIRREILPSGKSRAFVNDVPVVLTDLKQLGEELIRISSQHETLTLKETAFQRDLLDTFTGKPELIAEVKRIYNEWKEKSEELLSAQQEIARVKGDREYLEFQLNELQAANLESENLEELENELSIAEKGEQLIGSANYAFQILDEEGGILDLIGRVEQEIKQSTSHDQLLQDIYERLSSVNEELKDIKGSLERYADGIDVSPERLSYLNQRVDTLNQLLLKHRKDGVQELIGLRDHIADQLSNTESLELDLEQLRNVVESLRKKCFEKSQQLSKARKKAAGEISLEAQQLMGDLGMPDAEIKFTFETNKELSLHGTDTIELMFKANEGLGFQSLKKTASGGEMSRLMLALLSVYSQKKKLPTIIFDEIDTGVSGGVANQIAQLMRRMSDNMQVLSITHLPQVAAKGQEQFLVEKYKEGGQTFSKIRQLEQEERIDQLAKMLSGDVTTDPALQQAKELLKS